MPLFKSIARYKDLHLSTFWSAIALVAIVAILEFSTPPDYVFGYLYIGPILLTSDRFGRSATLQMTLVACALTLSNTWIPGAHAVSVSTIASRLIAALALIVTGFLSDRNRTHQAIVLKQQAKLQAQEKLTSVREDFASTLAHDLKTPLLGAIETLKAFQAGGFGAVLPTQKNVLATMIRSHQTSLQMVETLLDVYRNDTDGLKLQLVPVDLARIAEDVTKTLMELAASRRVHLSFNYGTSDFRTHLWVSGDAFQLQRVFANLLTNAINHSPRGGTVKIILLTGASYQTVKVSDTGPGIKPEERSNLFQRFYQGQSDRQAKGSGLGLYLTRQIVEAHSGTIWAEDNAPSGAVFAFRLPVLPCQAASI